MTQHLYGIFLPELPLALPDLIPRGFPGGASSKESTCQCRRHKTHRFDPWVRKVPGEGNSNPLQCSCLENPMDRGAWWATVHRVTKSQMPLKRFNMHACFWYPLFLDLALLLSFCLPAHLKSTSSCFSPHFYLFHFLCLPWWLSTWFFHCFFIRASGATHVCVCLVSHVQLFVTPWTVAHQAPLSMGFSKQECWSGLPFNTYFPFIPAFSKSFHHLSPISSPLQSRFWAPPS